MAGSGGRSAGCAEGRAEAGLDGGLGRRQGGVRRRASVAAQRSACSGRKPGASREGAGGHVLRRRDGGKVGLQRVVRLGRGWPRSAGGGGGQPEVKRGVRLGRREERQAFGQAQGGAVKAGAGRGFGPGAKAAQERQAVMRGFVGHAA